MDGECQTRDGPDKHGFSIYPVAYPSNLEGRPQKKGKKAKLSCLLLLFQSVSSTISTDVEMDGNRSITCSQ
jgi:hypothetical protein